MLELVQLFPSPRSFSRIFTPVLVLRGQQLRVFLQTLPLQDSTMRIHTTKPLFAWDELETSPTLASIRQALEAIPDAPLLHALQQRRHKGCDTYPITALWGVLLLSIILRHTSIEATLEDLQRNAALRLLIGIENEADVPQGWNMTRFLTVLGLAPHLKLLREVFDQMVKRLGLAVPDLGKHTAGDSTGLSGRRDPSPERAQAEIEDGLPQASGGRKEYKDDAGTVTKVVEWFGYKVHLLVDVTHEVVLSFQITDTKAGDNELIESLVEQGQGNLPENRIETLAYDKAADDGKVHDMLHEQGIKPLIQNRSCWPKDGEQEKVIGGRVPLHVVHDESGTVYCYDTQSNPPVRRAMSYAGHEKSRGTLKYRCPA
jgi:hypothetical protein